MNKLLFYLEEIMNFVQKRSIESAYGAHTL